MIPELLGGRIPKTKVQMEKYLLPKIVDAGGDLSARWYVEYKFKHPETNQYVKFREWISSKLNTRTARYAKATEFKKTITIKLQTGYNPFETIQINYSISEAFTEILNLKKAVTGKRTEVAYGSASKIFLDWLEVKNWLHLKPCVFDKYKAQMFLDYLLLERKISNRTHNNYLSILRTIFDSFFKRDYISVNVWKQFSKLKPKETNLSFFNAQERKQIAEILTKEHYQLYCVALLIYYCYLRPAEIVRLKITDIDFVKNQIIVKGSQSKNGRTQIVVMHPSLVECLKGLDLDKFPPHYNVFATSKRLLPSSTEIAPTRIADAWRKNIKVKYNIDKNIYDFKPSGVSEALESGIHAREIQLQIRHHSLDQTQIYLDKISNIAGQVFREKMPIF